MPVCKHECIANYTGSSKGMESFAIVEMVKMAPSHGFVVGWLVSDDDSTMRAHLHHARNHRDGKLPEWFLTPVFLADPSHRIKVVSKHFYALANAPVRTSRVNKNHAKRLKKDWGYMIRQNRSSDMPTFLKAAKAVLQHVFNNHQHCGDWCLAKKAEEEGKQYSHPEGWLSREDPVGSKIYDDLLPITTKYGSEHYLEQSRHEFDTQTNESLNQSQANLTPKAKVFHESHSFHYRDAICIGTHNWGFARYWSETFSSVGIQQSHAFTKHLYQVEKKRAKWKAYHSKRETKRRRKHKQNATEIRLMYENRTSTEYASGAGLDIGAPNQSTATPTQKRRKRTECKHCQSKTHFSSASRECPYNKKNIEEHGHPDKRNKNSSKETSTNNE